MTYVIHELYITDGKTFYSTFVEECIAKAPRIGIKYEANTRQVHQLILSITQGQPSQEWIKTLMKKKIGRIDMAALKAHYQGEEIQHNVLPRLSASATHFIIEMIVVYLSLRICQR